MVTRMCQGCLRFEPLRRFSVLSSLQARKHLDQKTRQHSRKPNEFVKIVTCSILKKGQAVIALGRKVVFSRTTNFGMNAGSNSPRINELPSSLTRWMDAFLHRLRLLRKPDKLAELILKSIGMTRTKTAAWVTAALCFRSLGPLYGTGRTTIT